MAISLMEKPTPEQIRKYANEQGYILDGRAFWHFYESKGWKVGNSPMKSWKSAVWTWILKNPKPLPRTRDEKMDEIGLEKKRQEKRKEYGLYFREKSVEELQELRKARPIINLWWLIDEVLAEKGL